MTLGWSVFVWMFFMYARGSAAFRNVAEDYLSSHPANDSIWLNLLTRYILLLLVVELTEQALSLAYLTVSCNRKVCGSAIPVIFWWLFSWVNCSSTRPFLQEFVSITTYDQNMKLFLQCFMGCCRYILNPQTLRGEDKVHHKIIVLTHTAP